MEVSAKTQRLTLQSNTALFNHVRTSAAMVSEPGMESEDTVNLSSGGSAAGDAVRSLKNMPEVREDKVAALKQRIAAGLYRVEGEHIAANLLTETEENNDILKQIGIDG